MDLHSVERYREGDLWACCTRCPIDSGIPIETTEIRLVRSSPSVPVYTCESS